ncbi:ATP-binding protein [Granulicoccus sp. GXG6511]|uniref:ATP-binding protein n=1 Tax=Granulicoccus sp. GXG6511 TaxID=3381351 RepID=UPI003D7CA9E7
MKTYRVEQLYRLDDPHRVAGLIAARLLTVAAELPAESVLTWEMANNGTGGTTLRLTDPTALPAPDLEWIFGTGMELVESTVPPSPQALDSDVLSEIVCAAAIPHRISAAIGFGVQPVPVSAPVGWPTGLRVGADLLEAVADTPGLRIRWHLQPCPVGDEQSVEDLLTDTWQGASTELAGYLGRPLRMRLLVASGGALPPRVRSLLRQATRALHLIEHGSLGLPSNAARWKGDDLSGAALPQGAVAALLQIPTCGPEPLRGVRTGERPARDRALSSELAPSGPSVRLGTLTLSTGQTAEARLGMTDLLRHLQIIGQTGTGKSTALAALVQEAARNGSGVTLIDPHGTTVDRVVAEAEGEYAGRIRVIRCADLEHVIPINPWAGRSEGAMEAEVAATLELLSEIFDPTRQGIVGPRFERWFSQMAALSRALLGPRASLLAMTLLGRDRDVLAAAAKRIARSHPDLSAQVLREVVAQKGGSDTADFDGWVHSKMQRLLATPELRALLGSGADGLALPLGVAEREITLVDLGMPRLGTSGAQVIGMFVLQQLWAAILQRQDREDPHLLVIDEAHLFQHGVLPSILAEGRKFGIGAVIAHQHQGQLSSGLHQALEANSASLLAFRCALDDAARLSARLGGWQPGELTRIPAQRAAATLTCGAVPSEAFTLVVDHNERVGRPPLTSDSAQRIILRSQRWARSFAHRQPITPEEIRQAAYGKEAPRRDDPDLERWLAELQMRGTDA